MENKTIKRLFILGSGLIGLAVIAIVIGILFISYFLGKKEVF